ncbi:hypothetical protein GCM10023339_13780 [Alloalcanivorax gelatiniphagus]
MGIKNKSITFGEIGLRFGKRNNNQYELASTINEVFNKRIDGNAAITTERIKEIREFGNK